MRHAGVIIIKDENDIYREGVNSSYFHEDAIISFMKNKNISLSREFYPSLYLAVLDYLVLSYSKDTFVLNLPNELNETQKKYLLQIEDYLRNRMSVLWIHDITKNREEVQVVEYKPIEMKEKFDDIWNRKVKNNKKLEKKIDNL